MNEDDYKYLDSKFRGIESKIENKIDKIEDRLINNINKKFVHTLQYNKENDKIIKDLEKENVKTNQRLIVVEGGKKKKVAFITAISTGSAMLLIRFVFELFKKS